MNGPQGRDPPCPLSPVVGSGAKMTPAPFRRAAVVGLGVVGIPVAAKIAEAGVRTVGLDVDEPRARAIAEGRYPFDSEEPGMSELLARLHRDDLLTATTDPVEALKDADAVVLVVQTPVDKDGVPRYRALEAALRSVGENLKQGALVVIESTIAPGTMRGIVQKTLEESSGMTAGTDFHLGHCPERVMPGKLLHNIIHYDRVVGGIDGASTERMLDLYRLFVKGELHPTDMTTAEVVKTTENAYRDVQIAFANEVARICQGLGVDVWEVRGFVNRVEDRNMHLPGVGVGGHCITKDGLLLAHGAVGFEPSLLRTARAVNLEMPRVTAELVRDTLAAHTGADGRNVLQDKRIVILGASYLPGSDDTRDAPTLPLAEALMAGGADVLLVDPHVPELAGHPVTQDLEAALDQADMVVVSTAHKEYTKPDWAGWQRRMRTPVAVDGRGVWDPREARAAGFTYRGIGR